MGYLDVSAPVNKYVIFFKSSLPSSKLGKN